MPAVLQGRTRGFQVRIVVAVVIAAAVIFDWSRPPARQASAYLYEVAVIRPYQAFGRPIASVFVRCRYRPTCSEYSREAVREYGFPVGAWMTTKRLFRCMPWVPLGSSDPVPPRNPAPQ